ncbi:FAD-binding oxidoreductase [Lapillicoccus sp.]|uniref:FAD-binding oxidoreductase n=1 Tax=Lapillicoccus sp. TaxID=1909287 RepID=UPI0025D36859|nr:FAD-binding oxidoreductase [Lapillicoccus sp.]
MSTPTATDLLPRLSDAAAGAVREGGDGDAVDGMPCRWVVSPADTPGVSAVLRVAHDEGLAVVVRGGGTKLGWGSPPERLDVILDTTRLDGLVDHAAGDLIAVVGAGRRLDDLQADLGAASQWFAVDPARRGTLGGLVATADGGPSRLLYGPVRDLVIGATMVRADGVVAKSGGKVVKNVAGYDLGKLLTGSLGTLGVITEVAVRLHPVAPAHRYVTVPVVSTRHAHALVQGVIHSHLVATACELDQPADGAATLAIRLDGIRPGVEARTAGALELLGAGAEASDDPPAWWGTEPGAPGDVRLKLTHEIASVTALLDIVAEASDRASVPVDVRGSVAVGTVTAALRAAHHQHDRAAVADLVDHLRAACSRSVGASGAGGTGGSVVVRDADPETKARLDVWGPVPALDLMRRVKHQLDPTRVLAPGRFVGGI